MFASISVLELINYSEDLGDVCHLILAIIVSWLESIRPLDGEEATRWAKSHHTRL